MSESPAEFRLARRLASAEARVEIDPERTHWLVTGEGRRSPVPRETIGRLQARGALDLDAAGRLRLSQAGRDMVRRRLAGGGDFVAQHQARERRPVEGEAGVVVTVDLTESPLAWLRSRKGADGRPMIDAAAFEAGERLRSDFTRGQLMPAITANWSAVGGAGRGGAGGVADLTDAALACRLRVERAMTAVGPEFSGPLIDLCCFLRGLEAIERERGWPKRSGKLVIQLALAALARHYGLSGEANGGPTAGRGRVWRGDDETQGG